MTQTQTQQPAARRSVTVSSPSLTAIMGTTKRRRWDVETSEVSDGPPAASSSWDALPAESPAGGAAAAPPPSRSRWDVTPEVGAAAHAAAADATPLLSTLTEPTAPGTPVSASRWDVTPAHGGGPAAGGATPGTSSRWDVTPDMSSSGFVAGGGANPSKRSRWDETPDVAAGATGPFGVATPVVGVGGAYSGTPLLGGAGGVPTMSVEALAAARVAADAAARSRPVTDEELDALLPTDGYKVLTPPEGYVPKRRRPVAATPLMTPLMTPVVGTPSVGGAGSGGAFAATPLYVLPAEGGVTAEAVGIPALPPGLDGIEMSAEDYATFGAILGPEVKAGAPQLSAAEQKKRRIMKLLLKVKNGSPMMRKAAFRTLSDKAVEFGAGPLFDALLPLLLSPTLEEQARHLLVKVIDRVLAKLEHRVRPYVHKILVVMQPLLIDEDYHARAEGREIIANLAKAAGLATMLATMRPDIDNPDDYVRNTTARALAVVASALGIPSMLPFLRAVCASRKSWEARHTGAKVVQQLSILVGCAVLPLLNQLVGAIAAGLTDEQVKVRTVTALALAALAESSAPYGIEAFDGVLKPLWKGIRQHRGKTLAAFLKAVGALLPLMDAEYASYYTSEVAGVLKREFRSPDDEMRKIVLAVVSQAVACDGVTSEYVRDELLADFLADFWVVRTAADRRAARTLADTTVAVAGKVGGAAVLDHLAPLLKHSSPPLRRLSVDTVARVAADLGLADVDARLETLLVDGLIVALQEEHGGPGGGGGGGDGMSSFGSGDAAVKAVSTVVAQLGTRAASYLPQLVQLVKWRLNHASAKVRQQAADLVGGLAPVLGACSMTELLQHVGEVLFEFLGEEFPDTLAGILGALSAVLAVLGVEAMRPPVGELLPRLTPVLKNRHERVQENAIVLVGRIARGGSERVSPKEWMRVCFELLELLKAPRKSVRRAAVATFGSIAAAIGADDVLSTLLNNLKVQERQQRVCTTVAIAAVAGACGPYTVVPGLLHEYRTPALNVQNGVLKSIAFLFESIGSEGRDYVYAVTGLLEDALSDRDLVHRQTACSAVAHIALGVAGYGYEDALVHLLNYVMPNVFETSPHVLNAVLFAIEGCTVALGPAVILAYLLQGLFHPASKVRAIYWRIYNTLYVYGQEALVPAWPRLDGLGAVHPDGLHAAVAGGAASVASLGVAAAGNGGAKAGAEAHVPGEWPDNRYARPELDFVL